MAVCVQDVQEILTSDASLEILDDIGFRGNPSEPDFTSKNQVLQYAMFFQILIFINSH